MALKKWIYVVVDKSKRVGYNLATLVKQYEIVMRNKICDEFKYSI